MELLHHYTSSTVLTLSSNPHVRAVWQDRVPRLALRTDYLLHALLALSAPHLAYLRPRTRHSYSYSYQTTGIQLYQKALGRAKVAMEHIPEKTCTELFLFSTLICFFSLAENRDVAAQSPKGDGDQDTDLLSWVFLFRGTKTLLKPPYENTLHSSPLERMFEQGRMRTHKLLACSTADAAWSRDCVCRPAHGNTRVRQWERNFNGHVHR